MKAAQQKRLVQRAFTGLAGSPLSQIAVLEPNPSSVIQVTTTVTELIDAVSDTSTDNQVKKVVRDVFSGKSKRKSADVEELPLTELEELPTPDGDFSSYNPGIYRTEINKALGSARSKLRGPEGRKDFEDLKQIVEIEIWKATKHYGDKMNAGLAYRIAKNQAGKFLTTKANQPKTLSLDARPENMEGVEPEQSHAETILNERHQEGVRPGMWEPFGEPEPADWLKALQEHGGIDALRQLVREWHGTKRIVGDFLLKHPDSTVRDIPSVPKSTAARVRQAVLAEFQMFIRGSHSPDNKADTNNGGTK